MSKNYNFSRWRKVAILKIVFGYNLASYRPFWADFCKIKQNGITEKGHVKLTVNIANFDFFADDNR